MNPHVKANLAGSIRAVIRNKLLRRYGDQIVPIWAAFTKFIQEDEGDDYWVESGDSYICNHFVVFARNVCQATLERPDMFP